MGGNGIHLQKLIQFNSCLPSLVFAPFEREEKVMTDQEQGKKNLPQSNLKLLKLTLEQVRRIDQILADLGEYGEVHIVVQRGELRYINKVESYKFWDKVDKAEL
jgi:hypothetical protein